MPRCGSRFHAPRAVRRPHRSRRVWNHQSLCRRLDCGLVFSFLQTYSELAIFRDLRGVGAQVTFSQATEATVGLYYAAHRERRSPRSFVPEGHHENSPAFCMCLASVAGNELSEVRPSRPSRPQQRPQGRASKDCPDSPRWRPLLRPRRAHSVQFRLRQRAKCSG